MNVLFLTMYNINSIAEKGIYEDLMREFCDHGHRVYVACPGAAGEKSYIVEKTDNYSVLHVKAGALKSANIIKKGLATLSISSKFLKAIKTNFNNVEFDLILYSTPPITLYKTIRYIKKRNKATTFLLLKDIFPQNAIDIGILKKTGIKGIIYRYFRKKEKKLYAISDKIGCMSQANVDYILAHDPEVDNAKLSIVPNSIEPIGVSLTDDERAVMRYKYGIPQEKFVFVYGGNLGKPQGIQFIIDCLRSQHENESAFFLIVGDGTEYHVLEQYVETEKPSNVKLMKRLPREDFDRMLAACDVGMIFLDHRFTIPNYPSRLLSYMQAGLPVLACTDPNTDVGHDIVNGGFGWWCESDDAARFVDLIQEICASDLSSEGKSANAYLKEHFTVADGYKNIIKNLGDNK